MGIDSSLRPTLYGEVFLAVEVSKPVVIGSVDVSFEISDYCMGLARDARGIWRVPQTVSVSFPDDAHARLLDIEEQSFWFKHRNACIAALAHAFPPPGGGPIFDVGGGNGFVAQGLRKAGFPVVLVEPGTEGAMNAKRRGLPHIVCAPLDDVHFKRETLPAIGLFDVIEHVEDDLAFLEGARRLLTDGGRLYLTTPAYPFLWSEDDVIAGHFRRYTIDQIARLVQRAGFTVDYASYFFRPLPLPIFLFRKLPSMMGLDRRQGRKAVVSKDHAVGGGILANAVMRVLRSEVGNISQKARMNFGASCILAASRSTR